MAYIDLNIISSEHLQGTWQVEQRFNNKGGTEGIIGANMYLTLEPDGLFLSREGTDLTGKWELFREQEIIYNPQVAFYQNAEKVASAIITRYLQTEENGTKVCRLTLYFTNGQELVLKK